MQETKKRVSDVITDKDISKWHNGDIVAISAGCGAGKSYFIKNVLYKRAKTEKKKILMLIHRRLCVDQFQMEIKTDNKSDIIDVQTYQSIEYKIINNQHIDFSQYAYIVSDEFHYFIEDSSFNGCTDLSFDIITHQTQSIKIFMSATGDSMLHILEHFKPKKVNLHKYSMKPDYSHIKSLTFFYKDETIDDIAMKLKVAGEKAIFFIQSVEKAHSLYKNFKDCSLFLCGQHSSSGEKFYKNVDTVKINSMLKEQRFNTQFLITTTCFDAGANIIDTDLHTVVLSVSNTSSLIQCLGRKRSQNANDILNVYIKAYDNGTINGMRSGRIEGIKRANYLLSYGANAYANEYLKSTDKFRNSFQALIYDEPVAKRLKNHCTKKVNLMVYEKMKLDIIECEKIKKMKYYNYIANKLYFGSGYGRYYRFYDENNIELYLQMLVDDNYVFLNLASRKPLYEKINVKSNGRLLKSIDSLNSALKERRIPYHIEAFETSRIIDGEKKKFKSAWKVVKIE